MAEQEIVGLVPMAGRATRLPQLPCSKEIYPLPGAGAGQPRVICEHLLGKMREAGVRKVFVVLRDGKWDIPAHLGDGSALGLHLAYLMMNLPYGTPWSADQGYPFVKDSLVAFGFPDMLFGPENIFATLIEHRAATAADVVLGLFPSVRPHKQDMVETDASAAVTGILIKPPHSDLKHTWGVALWTPIFTEFMHDYLQRRLEGAADAPERYIGDVAQAAINAGLKVQGVSVSEQPFIDIGTSEDLEQYLGSE